MNSKQRLRARLILAGIILAAGGLCASLYSTQIAKGELYAEKADRQYEKPAVALFDRGTILFESKNGVRASAATVAGGYLAYMNPKLLADPEQAYQALAQYIDMDKGEFMKKAALDDDPYEEISRRISNPVAASIQGLGIAGIGTAKETWRTYPGGRLAAHAIGVTGQSTEASTLEGKYGVERSYEEYLSRSHSSGGVGALGALFTALRSGGEQVKEGDVILTIEPNVEQFLESVLDEVAAAWRPDEAGGIILDPRSGEVIAMASLPTYDPNNLSKVKNVRVLSNPLVENVYEMGSIMKPLTMAAGIDAGAVRPDSTYDDTGTMTLSGKKISNYDGKARGRVSMQEVLSQSLNIGAATIALKLGGETLARYFGDFGLGEKTGIDLPNEAAGLVSSLKTGRDINVATASYGQGIAFSPIATARSLAVLANGGYVIEPRVVREIVYTDGTDEKITAKKTGPVLQKQTVTDVTKMLVVVVDTALRGGQIKMPHHTIAAKTGTAQIPDPSGGYYSDRYLHSFFGYFPAYDPKFLVFLYQVHPKGANYASETLTVPFADTAKFLINYYNVPPDR